MVAILTSLMLVAAGCTNEPPPDTAAPPSTVAVADTEVDAGILSVNVGIVLNSSSPTAERDAHLAEVMSLAASTVSDAQPVEVRVETATIGNITNVGSALDELATSGVTVIATSCDDASMPAVVDAAIEEQLLTLTACVALPRTDLVLRDRLFLDLASLDDLPAAMTTWAAEQDLSTIALLSSDLVPDVGGTCRDVEEAAQEQGNIEVVAATEFVELLDDVNDVVAGISPTMPEADAIVICALSPSLVDLATAVRSAGFFQPILVPWFGDSERWDNTVNGVFVFAPSSRYGDDPQASVNDLYVSLGSPDAVDVVAADTLMVLAAAAQRTQATGSRTLADSIRGETVEGISGEISVASGVAVAIDRSYRVIEIVDGTPEFVELVRR